MNIVLIHGQNHKGSTYHIGRMLTDKLGSDNKITEFFLPKDLNRFCTGCYRCIKNEADCPVYKEKTVIMNAILSADLLVFTTPTYCMRASAPMKAFIDLTFTCWISHKPKPEMFGKKAVVISTAAGAGTKSAIKDISTALFYWGVPCVLKYGIGVQAMSWDGVSATKKEKIQKATDRLAKKLLRKKAKTGIKTKLFFNVMRMMIKNYDDADADKRYWQEKGWFQKERPWKSK